MHNSAAMKETKKAKTKTFKNHYFNLKRHFLNEMHNRIGSVKIKK